jgi:hypothetical protein
MGARIMMRRLWTGAVTVALLLISAPASVAADTPTMSPITGPPTGGTIVVISGGSGYTDSTTVTICYITVTGVPSNGGTTLTFATPGAMNPTCSLGPNTVATDNPSTVGLPSFTYVPLVVAGPEGLTGIVRTADGNPRAGAKVWLIRTYDEGILATTTTDADGRYELAAPAGTYQGVFAQTRDPERPGDAVIVDHSTRTSLTVAEGRTTVVDLVLPEMSMTGSCGTTSCTVRVSIRGFGPLVPVEIYLQTFDISVDGRPFQLDLGTLTASASGAASGSFSLPRPADSSYFAAAASRPVSSRLDSTYSHGTLLVTTPRASAGRSWAATISGTGLPGRASLTVPATGWATAAFSLYHLKTGVPVTARILAGAACDATAATIKTLPGYTTTIGGTWRQRWVFGGAGLVRLRSAIRSGTPLWFDVRVGGGRVCTMLVGVDEITGNGLRSGDR